MIKAVPERYIRNISKSSNKHTSRWKLLPLVVLVFVLASVGLGVYAAASPLPQPIVVTQPLDQPVVPPQSINWPDFGQSAVGTADYGVLATHGDQKPLATASIAKVMTALAVLNRKPLAAGEAGPTITLTDADVAIYDNYVSQGGSVVYVVSGEQLTEYEALQALLLPSANNIADTLVNWAFGSVDAYLAYANDFASAHGWENTHFADASGLDGTTVSTARELTELGLLAMQNPVIREISNQQSAVIPVAGTIYNVNSLLGVEGIIGLKSGNNDADPGALLFAAERDIAGQKIVLVGVVMGASSLPRALSVVPDLVRSSAANFSYVTVVHAGTVLGSVQATWQKKREIIASQDLTMLVWHGHQLTTGLRINSVPPNTASGKVVGSVRASTSAGKTISIPATLQGEVSEPSFEWRIRHVLHMH